MGKDPIGTYMITQSVPTPNVDFTYARPQPQPYQKVTVPIVTPPYNGGRPQVGANATVTDLGLLWEICEPVDFGLFRQMNCRRQPKFQ